MTENRILQRMGGHCPSARFRRKVIEPGQLVCLWCSDRIIAAGVCECYAVKKPRIMVWLKNLKVILVGMRLSGLRP